MAVPASQIHAGLLELVGGDLEVPLVGGQWVRYANLDNAASAPALRPVADAVAEERAAVGSGGLVVWRSVIPARPHYRSAISRGFR